MRCQLYAALLPWRGDGDSRGQAGDQHSLAHSAPSLPTGSLAPGTAQPPGERRRAHTNPTPPHGDACARTPLRSGDAHAHPRKDGDTRTRTPAERRCTCTPGASCALVSKGKRAHRSWWAGEPLRSDPSSDERAESEARAAWTLESPPWVQMTSPSPRRCLRLSQEPSPGSG